jgi:hypothetical protein
VLGLLLHPEQRYYLREFKDAFMAATNIKDCFNIQPVY